MGLFSRQRKLPSTAGSAATSSGDAVGQTAAPIIVNNGVAADFPAGVKVWRSPGAATVDICFIHGLTGNRDTTWTAHGESDPWPKLLLAAKLPSARLITYGYDAYVLRKRVASRNRLIDHAKNLLNDLTDDREVEDAVDRPLIFVVHSMGGLVCKEAVQQSRNNPDLHRQDLFKSVKGIVFMGTPHQGSWMASWASTPASAVGLVKSTNKSLLEILQTENQLLESVHLKFLAMIRQLREEGREIEVICFFEELPLPVAGVVVTKESATLPPYDAQSIHANHSDMVKFSSAEDPGFTRVFASLRRWEAQARHKISERDRAFLGFFGATNPIYDKERIEATQGGLLHDCCAWVLEHDTFRNWDTAPSSRLLWVRGDAGKGKTMLLCGVIDTLRLKSHSATVVFSFFQGSDSERSKASTILQGLAYLLLKEYPQLIATIREKHWNEAENLSRQANPFFVLSAIIRDILKHPSLKRGVRIVIDALDECREDLPQLVDFIVATSSALPYTKWVVSSRNNPEISERLGAMGRERLLLSLGEEEKHVFGAVAAFVRWKVARLASVKGYCEDTAREVRDYLIINSEGTFLWVALACHYLEQSSSRVMQRLRKLPPGLASLYEQMMTYVRESDDADLCLPILRLMVTAYRPLEVGEIQSLSTCDLIDLSPDEVCSVVNHCGSFLTIRNGSVYFVHQSAKDYLDSSVCHDIIFPQSVTHNHLNVVLNGLHHMDRTLKANMHNLADPDSTFNDTDTPKESPTLVLRYASVFWVDHVHAMLRESTSCRLCVSRPDHVCDKSQEENVCKMLLADDGPIWSFLSRHFLHWIECLSFLHGIPEAIISIRRLLSYMVADGEDGARTPKLLREAERFLASCRPIIERAPLQMYGGALAFCPAKSMIRELFWDERLPFIQDVDGVDEAWDACLQVLEGHTGAATYCVFSGDGDLLASVSRDKTVRLWSTSTGVCKQLFKDYKGFYGALALDRGAKRVAFPDADGTIQVRDTESGRLIRSLRHKPGHVSALALSPEGETLVSGLLDGTIHFWDVATGASSVLVVAEAPVHAAIFDLVGGLLAFGSIYGEVQVWDMADRTRLNNFSCGPFPVIRLDGSNDTLVAVSRHGALQAWDVRTGICEATWEEDWDEGQFKVDYSPATKSLAVIRRVHKDWIWSIDKKWRIEKVEIWDATTRRATPLEFYHHGQDVYYTCFSPDGEVLATCSQDQTIRLWKAGAPDSREVSTDTCDPVTCLAFSPDGESFASGSTCGAVKTWAAGTGQLISQVKKGYGNGYAPAIMAVVFSDDNGTLAWSSQNGITTDCWGLHDIRSSYSYCPKARTACLLFQDEERLLQADPRSATISTYHENYEIGPFSRDEYPFDYLPHEGLYMDLDNPPCPADKPPPRFLMKGGRYHAMDWGYLLRRPEEIKERWAERLFVRGEWITWAGKNVVWLPPNYRPNCSALCGTLLLLGQRSGRVTQVRFKRP